MILTSCASVILNSLDNFLKHCGSTWCDNVGVQLLEDVLTYRTSCRVVGYEQGGLRLSVDFLRGKCLGMGAADWTITFLSLLNWVSRFRQGMILIRYAKLAVGLHLCRNHFAYSFGLREMFSRHFGLHDPSFFFCPHITVLIVRPFQYRLIYMDFFNESKNQIYLYLIVLILYYAEKTAAFILMTLRHQI